LPPLWPPLGRTFFELVAFEPGKAPAPKAPAPAPTATGCAPSACASCGTASTCAAKAPAPKAPTAEEAAEADDDAPAQLPELAPERLEELRTLSARYIAIAPGCDPCACDIQWMEGAGEDGVLGSATALPKPAGARVNVAVASSDGMDVDLHLGQAIKFLIFGPRPQDGLPSLLGVREAPEPGGGDKRWTDLAEALHDCFAILAASAGAHPREVLASQGLSVLTAETDIKGAVDVLYGGGKKNGKKRVKAN